MPLYLKATNNNHCSATIQTLRQKKYDPQRRSLPADRFRFEGELADEAHHKAGEYGYGTLYLDILLEQTCSPGNPGCPACGDAICEPSEDQCSCPGDGMSLSGQILDKPLFY